MFGGFHAFIHEQAESLIVFPFSITFDYGQFCQSRWDPWLTNHAITWQLRDRSAQHWLQLSVSHVAFIDTLLKHQDMPPCLVYCVKEKSAKSGYYSSYLKKNLATFSYLERHCRILETCQCWQQRSGRWGWFSPDPCSGRIPESCHIQFGHSSY